MNLVQAFFGAFLSYYLVKIVPYWGLALIATTTLFFAPLIYTSNQKLIDTHVQHATDVVNAQTLQLREAAQKQAAQASQLTKQYMGDYTAKAQEMLRSATGSVKPAAKDLKDADFPAAPKDGFKTEKDAVKKEETEPLIAT
jgi:hypothetical protein